MSLAIKVTLKDGTTSVHKITPSIEYAFEQHFKAGWAPTLDLGRNSDVYWVAWKCLQQSGVTVPPFGAEFMDMLEDADLVREDARPNG